MFIGFISFITSVESIESVAFVESIESVAFVESIESVAFVASVAFRACHGFEKRWAEGFDICAGTSRPWRDWNNVPLPAVAPSLPVVAMPRGSGRFPG